jgi:hypothetical protein
MVGSDRSANFVIKAKDAATGPLGKVGGAMGKLKKTSVTAFKVIAGAAIAAATAIAGFVAASIANAIADERSQIRLTAALEARGLATEKNTKKIEEAIIAGQKFAFSGEQIRTSLEIATQFTSNFSKALKIQRVAQDLAVAKNISLEQATSIVGKAFSGNGKALKAYGIELNKTSTITSKVQKITRNGAFMVDQTKTTTKAIKGQAALNAITEKFGGIADAVAESTSGRLAAAQERFNAAADAFAVQFLPVIGEILTFITEKALPEFQKLLDKIGPVLTEIKDKYVGPLFDSVGKLFDLFDKSDFNPFILALDAVKLVLDGIKLVIDLIVAGLKIIGVGKGSAPAKNLQKAAEDAGYGGGSYVNPMNRGGGTPTSLTTNTSLILDGQVIAQNTSSYLANQTRNTSPQRSYPRNP